MAVQIPLPVVIARENKWYVASCPPLEIATQGRTEREVRGNIIALIEEYLRDPDTTKPNLESIMEVSLTSVLVKVPGGVLHHKAQTIKPA